MMTIDWSIVTHDDYRLVNSHDDYWLVYSPIVFEVMTLQSCDITKSCMQQIDLNITFSILAPLIFVQFEKLNNWLVAKLLF